MRNAPLTKWQMPSSFCAGIQRSAIIPITAGMNSEATPIVAKKAAYLQSGEVESA